MIYIAKNAIKFSKFLDIATAEKSKALSKKKKTLPNKMLGVPR